MMTQEDDSYPTREKNSTPLCVFFKDARDVFKLDELGVEIAQIALALTADPIALLVDTAFIGQIGATELAAVGVSIALFNQLSRIAIFPLVSVTTSFVAEQDTIGRGRNESQETECLETGSCLNTEDKELIPRNGKSKKFDYSFSIAKIENKKWHIPSALVIGSILGLIQAFFLIAAAKPLLSFISNGVKRMLKKILRSWCIY